MIKKRIFLLVILCTFIFSFTSVQAANSTCPSGVKKSLAQSASQVKVNYEIKDFSEEKTLEIDGQSTTYKVPNYVFEISIYNLSDDVYAIIKKSNESRGVSVYNRDALDGVYTFTDSDFGQIYNYTVTLKPTSSECGNINLKTVKFTKPRYNAYSEFTYCQNSSNYYCQRFIGTEINVKDTADFLTKIKVNNEKNDPDRDKKDEQQIVVDLLKNNWKIYLLIVLIVIAVSTGVIFFVKYRQKKTGWKL